MIELKNISLTYNENTPFEKEALRDINITIEKGEFIGLIGHTGSGKSTLLQLLNGLELPTTGDVLVDGMNTGKKEDLKEIRKRVGFVFQYPEYQLFEETVEKDISYAPENYGLKGEELDNRVREAMNLAGLDYEKYAKRSPFELSGGEKRRVALAGVLAARPQYLILDEPTAGLDPKGRQDLLRELVNIREREGIAVLLVSHSMNDISHVAERILVLKEGNLVSDDSVKNTFANDELLKNASLSLPEITGFMKMLKDSGKDVRTDIFTMEEAVGEIKRCLEI
ncbi:MAG: energy-coupling factor transporter ATPase [Tissierellia bacterium]|nr:energy-coupling factor transporter ATPase [Tissierellia bacterium]